MVTQKPNRQLAQQDQTQNIRFIIDKTPYLYNDKTLESLKTFIKDKDNQSNDSKFNLLHSAITRSKNMACIMHRSIDELVNLLNVDALFSELSNNERYQLCNWYDYLFLQTQKQCLAQSKIQYYNENNLLSLRESKLMQQALQGTTIALNAAMGSGKTRLVGSPFIRQLREKGIFTLVLAHRVSLIKEVANLTGCSYYEDLKGERNAKNRIAAKENNTGIACCVDSLTNKDIAKLINEIISPDENATGKKMGLFIDEFHQVLKHLSSTNHSAKKLDAFFKIIKKAEYLIVADADLNDFCVSVLEYLGKSDVQIYYAKSDKSPIKVDLFIEHSKDHEQSNTLLFDAYQDLKNNKKVVIYSNRKNVAKGIYAFLCEKLPDKNFLLYCRDNATKQEVKAFKNDAEKESLKYDGIILSRA